MLKDEQSRLKTEAHVVQLFRERADQGDVEAIAAITAASAGPSFMNELVPDPSASPRNKPLGFAYGGIFPGTLHARGQVVKTHTVTFAVRCSRTINLPALLVQYTVA
jgi:hypothetical protein